MASLSVSTAWNETAAFMKREAGLILPIALLTLAVPSAAFQLAMPEVGAQGELPDAGLWLLVVPIVIVASIVGTLAISYLALRPAKTVGEGLQVGLRRFVPLFLASFLVGFVFFMVVILLVLIVGGGSAATASPAEAVRSLAIIVPILFIVGIFFWVRLMLMTPAAAVESGGPIQILRRSWTLTQGHFWKLLGMVLLVSIVGGILIFALLAIIGIVVFGIGGPPEPGAPSFILMTIISSLLSAVFSAVFIVLLCRVYSQLADSPARSALNPE